MAKTITLSYEGTQFILEMNRDAVRSMERNGFNINEIDSKPMTMIPELVYGAFVMHHARIKRSLVDEIYDSIGDKKEFLACLADMYAETLETLSAEPDANSKNSKNTTWKMN